MQLTFPIINFLIILKLIPNIQILLKYILQNDLKIFFLWASSGLEPKGLADLGSSLPDL